MVRIHSGPPPAIVLHRPTVTDVTGARALGTIYQNAPPLHTHGRPILVIVSVSSHTEVVGAWAYALTEIGATTPPTLEVGGTAGLGVSPAISLNVKDNIVYVVPTNYYYRTKTLLNGANSSVSLGKWIEMTL